MIDPNLIDQFTKDHQKNQLSKEEAKAFLLDVMRVCKKRLLDVSSGISTVNTELNYRLRGEQFCGGRVRWRRRNY